MLYIVAEDCRSFSERSPNIKQSAQESEKDFCALFVLSNGYHL